MQFGLRTRGHIMAALLFCTVGSEELLKTMALIYWLVLVSF